MRGFNDFNDCVIGLTGRGRGGGFNDDEGGLMMMREGLMTSFDVGF